MKKTTFCSTLFYRVLFLFLTVTFSGFSQISTSDFVTTWQTTSVNETVTIPTNPTYVYDYEIDWDNDGVFESSGTTDQTHLYLTPGSHTIRIRGVFPQIYFNNSGDKDKIRTIDQWGDNQWLSMAYSFRGCSNLMGQASDVPDLSSVTNMVSMFAYATSFNQDIGGWDVSNVLYMSNLFEASVSFNQDIGGWDVSNVVSMSRMFSNAGSFDQDISGWDVSNVTNMLDMFSNAESFNQNIGNWNLASVSNMVGMLSESGLSLNNYDSTLLGWETSSNTPSNLILGADGLTYCNATSSRLNLTGSTTTGGSGWVIIGDSQDCPSTETDLLTFVTARQIGQSVIDLVNHTIVVEVQKNTSFTSLVSSFTLSEGATASVGGFLQVSGLSSNDFSSSVTYTVLAEDGVTSQDWVVTVVEETCLDTFPLSNGLENDLGIWTQNTDDGMDWTFNSGSTSSSSTGPSSAQDGVSYLYTEASGANSYKTANLTSKCVDLSGLQYPSFSFWYHMYGSAMGSLAIDIEYLDNGVLITDNLFSKSGNQGNVWNQEEIDLSLYKDKEVVFKIKGTTGYSYTSDIAIDGLEIYERIPSVDTDITAFGLIEENGVKTIDLVNHTVDIEVLKGTDLTNLVPSFTLSGGATVTVGGVSQVSGVTANDFSGSLTYVVLAEDGVTSQDWILTIVEEPCFDTFPMSNSLENDLGIWTQNTDDGMDWSFNSGPTGSSSTGPSSAQDGAYYMYTEASNYNYASAILTSKCIDLSGLQYPSFSIWYHMYGSAMGSLDVEIEYLDNGILVTDNLFSKSGDQGDVWSQEEIDLSLYKDKEVVLKIKGVTGYSYQSDISIDGLEIYDNIPNVDTDIISFGLAEENGVKTIDLVNHTVDIEVLKGTDLTNLVPSFTLSEGATVTVGGVFQISGITSNDFSNSVTYVVLAEDGITLQDWVVTIVEEACLDTFPMSNSLENDLGIWTQNTDDGMDWSFNSGPTGSSFTGPSSAQDGSYYMYTEASNYNYASAILTSKCIDLSGLQYPRFSFWYHMYGSAMGSLTIDIEYLDNGVLVTDNLFSQSGDQGNVWNQEQINLSLYKDKEVVLKITGITGNSYESDIAIDGLEIQEGTPSVETDIVAFGLTEGSGVKTIDLVNHTVDIEVLKGADLTSLVPSFTLSGGATVAVGGVSQTSGVTSNDFSNSVTYTVLAEDGVTLQDWVITVVEETCFDTFPMSNSFENDLGIWTQDTDDDLDWTFNSGPTGSSSTGPSSAQDGVSYLYTEASGSNTYKDVNLTSKCIDLSGLQYPSFSFWYHMYGSAMGSLDVEIEYLDNGVLVSDNLFSKSGNQGDVWSQEVIDLSLYKDKGGVLKIKGTTGYSYQSDIAIDGLKIYDNIPNVDTDIITFGLTEENGVKTIDLVNHTIDIEVVKGADLMNLVPSFTFSEGATVTVGGLLQTSGVTSNDFSNSVTYVVLAEDGITSQDWVVTIVEEPCLDTFPMSNSFENDLGIWTQNTDDVMDWTFNSGSTSSSSTGPSSAQDGSYYMYIEASSYNYASATLTSKCVDLSGLQYPRFSFWYHMYGSAMGSLDIEIEYLDNGILVTDNLFSISGNKGNVWNQEVIDLSLYKDKEVVLKIKGVTGSSYESDIAIDGIEIYEDVPLSNETDILTFVLSEQTSEASIDNVNHTVLIKVADGTDLTSLIPVFTLSSGAVASVNTIVQTSGSSFNDYSDVVIYSLLAEDGVATEDWFVTVESGTLSNVSESLSGGLVLSPNPAQDIVSVSNSGKYHIERIFIYDMYSHLIEKVIVSPLDENVEFSVRHLKNGVYLVVMESDSSRVVTKMIKK